MARVADTSAAPAVYQNPFRNARVTPGRIDQGIDYSGTGPIHALGPGVIEQTTNAGWQPGGAFIAERLTAGPDAGKYVYFAEDIQPVVRVGQHVDSSTVIGYFAPSGGVIEAGWAAPPPQLGQALAYVEGQSNYTGDPGANPTPEGRDFAGLLQSLGAPVSPGATVGTASSGGLLSGCVGTMLLLPFILAHAGLVHLRRRREHDRPPMLAPGDGGGNEGRDGVDHPGDFAPVPPDALRNSLDHLP